MNSIVGCKNRTDASENRQSDEIFDESEEDPTPYDPLLDDVIVIRRQTETVSAKFLQFQFDNQFKWSRI